MSQSQFDVAVACKDRLGVLDMSGTGGGIAGVANGGAAGVFLENRAVFARVRCAKDLGDCADTL